MNNDRKKIDKENTKKKIKNKYVQRDREFLQNKQLL